MSQREGQNIFIKTFGGFDVFVDGKQVNFSSEKAKEMLAISCMGTIGVKGEKITWHLNLDVIDRILMNFDRTTGIFGCILWTKLMAVLLLAISCMGTIGVKGEKITWQRIWAVLTAGAVLFFMNWWLLDLPFPHEAITALYVVTLAAGYLCLLMAGLWISRLYRHNLMEDVFNMENESFMQETRLMENNSLENSTG